MYSSRVRKGREGGKGGGIQDSDSIMVKRERVKEASTHLSMIRPSTVSYRGQSLNQVSNKRTEQERRRTSKFRRYHSIQPCRESSVGIKLCESTEIEKCERFTARTETVMITVSPTRGEGIQPGVSHCQLRPVPRKSTRRGAGEGRRWKRKESQRGGAIDIEGKSQYPTRTGRTIFIIKLRSRTETKGSK